MDDRLKWCGGTVTTEIKKHDRSGTMVQRSHYNPVNETGGNTTTGTANKRHKERNS
jgi:hypothetical protein